MALPYSFQELPDTYIIFITEKDFYGLDKPVYSIERINLDTGKPFEDGEHILYVNDEYRGESDMGKLMHDFNCTRAEGINFELLAERTRYLKNDPKGVQEMSKIMEDKGSQGGECALYDQRRGTASGKDCLVFRIIA